MLTLHHLEKSRSFRIVWLLEELKQAYGLEYQLVTYARDAQTFLAPNDLQALHPMGKAPILFDDSLPVGEQALAESAFIIEYLLKYYDKNQLFTPKDAAAWRHYTFWLHFAEGSLLPPLVMRLILTKASQKAPWFAKPIIDKFVQSIGTLLLNKNIRSALTLIEQTLQKRPWFAETFTGADVQMHFGLAALEQAGQLKPFPHIQAWLTACKSRPAFQRALINTGEIF